MGTGEEWVSKVGKKMRTLEERTTRNGKARILEGSSVWLLKLLRIMPGQRGTCVSELNNKVLKELGFEGLMQDG